STIEARGRRSDPRQTDAPGRPLLKVVKPAARRLVAAHWRDAFGVSERRATRVIAMHRSTARYRPQPDDSRELRERMRRLAAECPRAGYRLMLDRIRWEGPS